jgi:hypothetical protein
MVVMPWKIPVSRATRNRLKVGNLTFVAAFGDSYWVADPGLLSPSTLAQRLGIEASSISWSTPR